MTRTPEEWAALLKENWSKRAASPNRDFYVASHPGWNDEQRWKQQAEVDANLLFHGLDAEHMRTGHVLEIGCGVGRLAEPILARSASYTGFDIAKDMIATARERHAGRGDARFFETDGLSLPEPVLDRRYRLVLAHAVFIHCPRPVVASLVSGAFAVLEEGGEIRMQLLADPSDPAGVESVAAAEPAHVESEEMEAGATEEQLALIDGHYYMGDAFRYDEVEPFLAASAEGGEIRVVRLDLGHMYGVIKRVRP